MPAKTGSSIGETHVRGRGKKPPKQPQLGRCNPPNRVIAIQPAYPTFMIAAAVALIWSRRPPNDPDPQAHFNHGDRQSEGSYQERLDRFEELQQSRIHQGL